MGKIVFDFVVVKDGTEFAVMPGGGERVEDYADGL
jgi:hypothetical protein